MELMIVIAYIVGSVVNYKFGYRKGYKIAREESLKSYESLNEREVDKICDWHSEYVFRVGSYPENWDVIRKINKNIGRG